MIYSALVLLLSPNLPGVFCILVYSNQRHLLRLTAKISKIILQKVLKKKKPRAHLDLELNKKNNTH